jgi:hypothetical protein
VSAEAPPRYEPTWARRIPGWSLLLFFLSLAVLTAIAAAFNNANDLGVAGYFAGLASTVPLLSIIIPYYARPVWSIQIPAAEEVVAGAISTVLSDHNPQVTSQRKGPFAHCTSVLVLEMPSCGVGWYHTPPPPESVAIPPRSVIILAARSREKGPIAALREALRMAMSQAVLPA